MYNYNTRLGLRGEGVICNDLEYYDSSSPTSACSVAAINYIGAWVSTLNSNGLLAGVYINAPIGGRDLVYYIRYGRNFHVPDDVWPVNFGSGSCTSYCSRATVYDPTWVRPYIPDTYWHYYQRGYQYTPAHLETYPPGGVRLNIDSDCWDGEVIGPGAANTSSCGRPYD